jgi:hypothetical protein
MDFLCPLDNDNMPANDMSAITWPNLQTITLDKYPPVLPSGITLSEEHADEQQTGS